MTPPETRQQRLAAALDRHGFDAAVLAGPGNVCYATGMEYVAPLDASTEFAAGPTLAFVAADEVVLLVPDGHAGHARAQADGATVVPIATFGHFTANDADAEFRAAVVSAVERLRLRHGARIGIEPRWLPAGAIDLMLAERPDLERGDATPALEAARLIKTPDEIARIRRAVACADAGQERLMAAAQPRANELELWGEVVAAVVSEAGRDVPCVGELVSGPRTGVVSYPAGPIDRQLQAGDTVLMDLSVRVDGYWADCTNTFVAGGEPGPEQSRCYRASRAAIDAAVEQLRPGRVARDAASAANAALARHHASVSHYTGHQIGVTVNERPRIVTYDTTQIAPGMVFAVEPGAYAGLEVGTGARSEKVVVVTDDGPQVLSAFRWGMD